MLSQYSHVMLNRPRRRRADPFRQSPVSVRLVFVHERIGLGGRRRAWAGRGAAAAGGAVLVGGTGRLLDLETESSFHLCIK
jgi:hypothetical protein